MLNIFGIILFVAFMLNTCSRDEDPVVGNKNTGIFHIKGCPNYERMLIKNKGYDNRIYFKDQEEAIASGYRKAHNCL